VWCVGQLLGSTGFYLLVIFEFSMVLSYFGIREVAYFHMFTRFHFFSQSKCAVET